MGAGIEMISLKPRTQSVVEDEVYKVDERVTALSYEVHMKYTSPLWYVAAKVFWVPILHKYPCWADTV